MPEPTKKERIAAVRSRAGKLGAAARKKSLAPEERTQIASTAGRSGGPARARSLTKEQRRKIASDAAKARWAKRKTEA